MTTAIIPNVIDFGKAAKKVKARRAADKAAPFTSPFLARTARKMSLEARGAIGLAVLQGIANGTPTADIIRSLQRDAVRQAARAAL